MKKILHILPQFHPGGGMERVVMNYFDNLDNNEFHFDILTHEMNDAAYADRIRQKGGKVFRFDTPRPGNIGDSANRFRNLLRDGKYDVIHCHMANAAFLYLRIAQQESVPLRILHSHQDHYSDDSLHALRNIPLILWGKRYANCRVACSRKAGDFLFHNEQYYLVKNGIDLNKFIFDLKKRANMREKMRLNDDCVLFGQVGRLVPQKNPLFGIRVFNAYHIINPNSKMLFAGEGTLVSDLENYIVEHNLENEVQLLGNVNYIPELDSALDVLLMPSLYEGLGLSLVEAQATGLCSFASDVIPQEAFASEFVIPLSLRKSPEDWASAIQDRLKTNHLNRNEGNAQVALAGFDARKSTQKIEEIYTSVQ